jgi:AAA family ATP:ADP antiporter
MPVHPPTPYPPSLPPLPLKLQKRRGTFRDTVFPLYGQQEVHKFFAMGMIKFLVVFVLTITRDVKDTLIVTHCGAESIAFVKVLSN